MKQLLYSILLEFNVCVSFRQSLIYSWLFVILLSLKWHFQKLDNVFSLEKKLLSNYLWHKIHNSEIFMAYNYMQLEKKIKFIKLKLRNKGILYGHFSWSSKNFYCSFHKQNPKSSMLSLLQYNEDMKYKIYHRPMFWLNF